MDNAVADADPIPIKKKPGRPPKKKTNAVVDQYRGILTEPAVPGNCLELEYNNPLVFKKIFAMLKKYDVSEVIINFGVDTVSMITPDHLGKSFIYATLDAKYMDYYCAAPILIKVSCVGFDKAFESVGKNNFKLIMYIHGDNRKILNIVNKNIDAGTFVIAEIDAIEEAMPIALAPKDDTNYPLKFTLSPRQFKEAIKCLPKTCQYMIISKVHAQPLRITAARINGQGLDIGSGYDDTAALKLINTLEPDDIIMVTLCIDYIKPFSDAITGDHINIAIDKNEWASFTTQLDKKDVNSWVCQVKVYTEIKKD